MQGITNIYNEVIVKLWNPCKIKDNIFLNEENYNLEVEYLGTEFIETKIGKIRCLKFSPKVQVGRVFKNEDDLTIWVSDDENHLLVKVEMGIWIGSIDATITSTKNIKFPLSITD